MAISRRTVLNFRPPSTTTSTTTTTTNTNFTPPPVTFLQGKWYVTHSTLPMWKTNRNVSITYTSLPNDAHVLDDLVEYQPLDSNKHKKIEGIDTPDAHTSAAYGWRGKGWLKIASSRWLVLGYGDQDGGWAVTYFQKTLFTPAGIDIYARRSGGLSDALLEQIQHDLRNVDDAGVQGLAERVFVIRHDW